MAGEAERHSCSSVEDDRRSSIRDGDERFLLKGRGQASDVRVWPGLAIRGYWILADRSKVELRCGVNPREGDGARPLFYCFASPADGQKIGVKGHSTSAVAEQLLKQPPAPEDNQDQWPSVLCFA